MLKAVLFDVDGTLVDSNDAHAHAWVKAFSEAGAPVRFEDVRRCIGMGSDKLLPAVAGLAEDSTQGQWIAKRRGEIFAAEHLPHLRAFRGPSDLVAALKARGLTLVAASSAKREELQKLLAIAGTATLLDAWTSGDDADASKPDPDIVQVALERARSRPEEAVMVGDTPYDIEAARRAGVRTIAFRTGGWPDADLAEAIAIYDGPWDLAAHLAASPLGDPAERT